MGPPSPEVERQVCESQSHKTRGCCNLGHRDHISHQIVSRLLIANYVFLVSWMVHICQECHSLRSAPKRRCMAHLELFPHGTPRKPSRELHKIHGPPGTVCSPSTRSLEHLGPGKVAKLTAHRGLCPCRALENLSDLDLRSAQNAGLTWDSALAEHSGG